MAEIPTIESLGEDALIDAIALELGDALPPGWIGIGDDAAVTRLGPDMAALTTTDLLIEDVHFRRSTTQGEDLGWKAIAVNASDIAAMGGAPRWATMSLALPANVPLDWVLALYRGAAACCRACELHIVGGDTVRSPGPLMIAVTVVGEAERPVLRTGAMPGDAVLVTGVLGASGAGLWVLEHPGEAEALSEGVRQSVIASHLRPVAQIEAGQAIARMVTRAAMMDCSDGLARSVLCMAKENQLEIAIDAASLPLNPETRQVAELAEVDARRWALYGGEDYCLVMTCPAAEVAAVRSGLSAIGVTATVVGHCSAGTPGAVLHDGPASRPLSPKEIFQHFGP